MQWLTEHLPVASTVGAFALVLLLWRLGLVQGTWRMASGIIRAIRENQLRSALRECEQLTTVKLQLEDDLQQQLRTNLAYANINAQDRATIRILVGKIDHHNGAHLMLNDDRMCLIDYSDLAEEVKRALT